MMTAMPPISPRLRVCLALVASCAATGCPDDSTVVGTDTEAASGGPTSSDSGAPDDDGNTSATPGDSGSDVSDGTTAVDGTTGADSTAGDAVDTGPDDTTSGPSDSSSDDGSSTGIVNSVCGDATVEGLEECDGDNLDGSGCTDLGFTGGVLSCNRDCLFEISACFNAACGNDIVEGDEPCDGVDLGVGDCVGEGFDGGVIACADGCVYDVSGCTNFECGNAILEGDELCDTPDLDGETCTSQGFDAGDLGCAGDCMSFDTSACVEYGGDCCIDNGTPGCEDDTCWPMICAADDFCCDDNWDNLCRNAAIAQCEVCVECGDELINVGETCDGTNLAGESCVSQGFGGGTLACLGDCGGFDTAGCFDGACCDGNNGTPGCEDADCVDEICAIDPFCCDNSWDLMCSNAANATCAICGVVCGDAMVAGGEDCDGANLDGQTCASLPGFTGGTLSCNGDCSFNTTNCDAPPSWANDIQPIWNASCGCHSVAGATAPTFSNVAPATSRANLVNVQSGQVVLDFVEPGNSGSSYLIDKLDGTQAVGSQMPLVGANLTPAQIAMIAEWIDAGAPNN